MFMCSINCTIFTPLEKACSSSWNLGVSNYSDVGLKKNYIPKATIEKTKPNLKTFFCLNDKSLRRRELILPHI